MASIQEEILEEFFSKLKEVEGFDEERVGELRVLFGGKKKPKAPDLIKAFSDDLKESQP